MLANQICVSYTPIASTMNLSQIKILNYDILNKKIQFKNSEKKSSIHSIPLPGNW